MSLDIVGGLACWQARPGASNTFGPRHCRTARETPRLSDRGRHRGVRLGSANGTRLRARLSTACRTHGRSERKTHSHAQSEIVKYQAKGRPQRNADAQPHTHPVVSAPTGLLVLLCHCELLSAWAASTWDHFLNQLARFPKRIGMLKAHRHLPAPVRCRGRLDQLAQSLRNPWRAVLSRADPVGNAQRL